MTRTKDWPDWPAAMRRSRAAAYCDLSEAAFEGAILRGEFPKPFLIGRQVRWSRTQLDKAIAVLAGDEEPDWRKDSPLYAGLE